MGLSEQLDVNQRVAAVLFFLQGPWTDLDPSIRRIHAPAESAPA
jgi:hypothetical protein